MKILLIEDCRDAVLYYKLMIGKHHELVVATDYWEFRAELDKLPLPELVLTDFNFPNGDGNRVAIDARIAGVKNIFLQSSDITNCKRVLFDKIFQKCSKDILTAIKAI